MHLAQQLALNITSFALYLYSASVRPRNTTFKARCVFPVHGLRVRPSRGLTSGTQDPHYTSFWACEYYFTSAVRTLGFCAFLSAPRRARNMPHS